ncbi:MAG TPA: carboxylesterase family protein [Caulobacteraceae bacterium]
MRNSSACGQAAAGALAMTLCAGGAQGAPDVVRIGQGLLEGVQSGDVVSFKDIPYAAPPVGALRWRPPQAPLAWTGSRKADTFGPACMQPAQATQSMSEDCLSLNIWTPANLAPGERAPVMVWIHGGAFVWGSGAMPFYDGTHFAEHGVVLVTINYRLGRFGFFAHPALAATDHDGPLANYGLMDQIAALKWVRANIAPFGGDPANVTVSGESSGGISVNYLMTSPLARGLFAKAISESGFGRIVGAPIRGGPNSGEAIGARIAQALGVKGDDAVAASALRALPADRLNATPSGLADPEIPAPMIDGKVVPETISAAFAAGREARVPFLVGGNSWEASLFPDVAKDPELTLAQAGAERARLVELYGGPANLGKVATDVTTDAAVTEPDRFLALALTRDGQAVFVYHFAYVPQAQRASTPGAAHGAEVMYAFDNLPAAPFSYGPMTIPAATAEDRRLGTAINAYWARFVATSTPDSAGGAPWPRFTAADQTVMVFGPDGPTPTADFRKDRLDFLAAHAERGAPAASR